jgi:hypothetical protein
VTQKEFFEFFEFFSPTRTNLVTRLRLPNFGSSMHPPVIVLVGLPAQQPPKPLIYEIILYIMAQSHNTKVLWLTKTWLSSCGVLASLDYHCSLFFGFEIKLIFCVAVCLRLPLVPQRLAAKRASECPSAEP